MGAIIWGRLQRMSKRRKWIPIAYLAWGLIFSMALAENNEVRFVRPKIAEKDKEFRFAGGTLVCITFAAKDSQEEPPKDVLPCLRIGPLALGQSILEVQTLLGRPEKIIPLDNTTESRVYVLDRKEAFSYFVVTFFQGRSTALQLTGAEGPRYAFSSIKLGDSVQWVRDVLGSPRYIKPVESISGELWDYSPFSISLEIKNERVYSIRIEEDKG